MFSHMVRRPVGRVARYLLDKGRNPDSSESHSLNIVQLAGQAFPCATAVDPSRGITSRGSRQVRPRKAVSHDLVNALRPPSCGCEGCGWRNKGSCHEEGEVGTENHVEDTGQRRSGMKRRAQSAYLAAFGIITALGISVAWRAMERFISQNRRDRTWEE